MLYLQKRSSPVGEHEPLKMDGGLKYACTKCGKKSKHEHTSRF